MKTRILSHLSQKTSLSILVIFALVISANKEAKVAQKVILDQVPCIYYLVEFQKNKGQLFKP